jgi:hypothetical protein
MMEFFTNLMTKDVAEVVYYVTAGPILVLIAAYGLKQISVARQSSQVSAKRDSYRLAVERVHFYMNDVITSINELNEEISKFELNEFDKYMKIKVENGVMSIEFDPPINLREKLADIAPKMTVCLNKIESFSLPFAANIADRNIAYLSVGATFVNSLSKYCWMFPIVGNEYYSATQSLFSDWYKRKKEEEYRKEKKQIEEKLKMNGNTKFIKTIGE